MLLQCLVLVLSIFVSGDASPRTIVEAGITPYQVSIQTRSGSHFCSGVIIQKTLIVTAASCVAGWHPSLLRVVAGTDDLSKAGAVYGVKHVNLHCAFDKPVHHNDIALLELFSPIEYNDRTQPIEYTHERVPPGSVLTITGWGATSSHGKYEDNLQSISVPFMSYEDCLQETGNDPRVDYGQICTKNTNSQGFCYGDSGGPVVLNGKLVGIVSWGYPCSSGKPDMHTSMAFYYDFIRTKNQGCFSIEKKTRYT